MQWWGANFYPILSHVQLKKNIMNFLAKVKGIQKV
jgi:hypothetical protein